MSSGVGESANPPALLLNRVAVGAGMHARSWLRSSAGRVERGDSR